MNNIDKAKELVEKLKIEKEKWTNRIYGVGETRVDLMLDEVVDTITKLLALIDNHRMAFEKQTENLREVEIERDNAKEELEKYKKISERYEKECRTFRAFCRRVRKDEKRDVDEFNQGREYAYIQFLNLINGEQNWEHEGKHFDEVDQELENWARKEVEKDVKD